MKIYTQSKSWLAKFSVDLSRGIVAAIVATVLLTTGVLVSGLVVFSGSAPAQQPGHDGYSPPSSSSVVSAQDVATSIVGMSVSDSSASEPGAVVNSDYPSGIVTTDAAGDATVPVEITLYTPPANTPGGLCKTLLFASERTTVRNI